MLRVMGVPVESGSRRELESWITDEDPEEFAKVPFYNHGKGIGLFRTTIHLTVMIPTMFSKANRSYLPPHHGGGVNEVSRLSAANHDGEIVDLPSAAAETSAVSLFPHLNWYWIGGTGLAFWFFVVHTPPFLRQHAGLSRSGRFIGHLIGVVGVYVACIHNTLITPSMW